MQNAIPRIATTTIDVYKFSPNNHYCFDYYKTRKSGVIKHVADSDWGLPTRFPATKIEVVRGIIGFVGFGEGLRIRALERNLRRSEL